MNNLLKKIIYFIIAIAILGAIYFYSKKSNNRPSQTNSEEQSLDLKNKETTTIKPESANTVQKPQAIVRQSSDTTKPNPTETTPDQYNENTFSEKQQTDIDKEHFKKVTEETTKKLNEQMRQEEITSLKKSITYDKELLKKIEDSGSGIEDYKYIQQNMKKRIDRLKVLTKNQKDKL